MTLMSPAVAARFKTAKGFLNRQMARTVHFTVLAYFIVFILGHVAMVFTTGLIENLNHITRGVNDSSFGGLVLFLIGVAVVVAAWVLATPLRSNSHASFNMAGDWSLGGPAIFLRRRSPLLNSKRRTSHPTFGRMANRS